MDIEAFKALAKSAPQHLRGVHCEHCQKSMLGEHRYRLHYEPWAIRSTEADKFFCSVQCIRDWAVKENRTHV